MRSREFCAGPKLFAQAAKWCLIYLCDHTAFGQNKQHRMSAKQRMRRKCSPWKWHRRAMREDIRGPLITPWLWIRRLVPKKGFSNLIVLGTSVPHRKANDLVYAHSPHSLELGYSTNKNDPVFMCRLSSERYHLALNHFNYFLPRAEKLEELVHMCQTLTFASLSQNFPRKCARARSNMQKYAAQW